MAVIGTVTDECVEHFTVFKMTLHVGDPEDGGIIMGSPVYYHVFVCLCGFVICSVNV